MVEGAVVPTVAGITVDRGVAGALVVSCDVTFPGEQTERQQYAGNAFGGPVVAIAYGRQVFVTDPGRHGEFGADPAQWLRRYYSERAGGAIFA